jgi:hypothetical protein
LQTGQFVEGRLAAKAPSGKQPDHIHRVRNIQGLAS